ncbi:MAG: dihydropteroate synthase [Gammaproteobacteria bacterium]|jgi:dihydropteroate synthase
MLQLPKRALDLGKPVVMGILNVTPDSFSDGGRFVSVETALAQGLKMVEEGARILDIGGESTRPGAQPVSEAEELDRVLPVIEALRRASDVVLSIDTCKPAVMRAACAAGAEIINDVNALRAEGALEVAARSGAAVCLMHMQGEPRSMQKAPHYADVVGEVHAFLQARAAVCEQAGIRRECLILDPGIGFGKTLAHNLRLLAAVEALCAGGYPVLIGVSRKSMFQQLLGLNVDERLPASLAAATLAVWQGAAIVRAHDVKATVEALAVAGAIRRGS